MYIRYPFHQRVVECEGSACMVGSGRADGLNMEGTCRQNEVLTEVDHCQHRVAHPPYVFNSNVWSFIVTPKITLEYSGVLLGTSISPRQLVKNLNVKT